MIQIRYDKSNYIFSVTLFKILNDMVYLSSFKKNKKLFPFEMNKVSWFILKMTNHNI